MRELPAIISTVELLLDLAPEELGAKLLFAYRARPHDGIQNTGLFVPADLTAELWNSHGTAAQYPLHSRTAVELALTEAWAWLEAQGLIVPKPGQSVGGNPWRVLSRRAQAISDETEFARYEIARRLPKEILHPRISDRTWASFMRGDYDGAVFHAMKTVEVAVRDATGIAKDGVHLMRAAFHQDNGPLRDPDSDGGEREARMHLFSGAIGSFKNPQSHRDVNLDDPQEAIEIIMLANRLLRIVDQRVAAGLTP